MNRARSTRDVVPVITKRAIPRGGLRRRRDRGSGVAGTPEVPSPRLPYGMHTFTAGPRAPRMPFSRISGGCTPPFSTKWGRACPRAQTRGCRAKPDGWGVESRKCVVQGLLRWSCKPAGLEPAGHTPSGPPGPFPASRRRGACGVLRCVHAVAQAGRRLSYEFRSIPRGQSMKRTTAPSRRGERRRQSPAAYSNRSNGVSRLPS